MKAEDKAANFGSTVPPTDNQKHSNGPWKVRHGTYSKPTVRVYLIKTCISYAMTFKLKSFICYLFFFFLKKKEAIVEHRLDGHFSDCSEK